MISLVLSLILNGQVLTAHEIDNTKFSTVAACELYKKRMGYRNTSTLKFNCTK